MKTISMMKNMAAALMIAAVAFAGCAGGGKSSAAISMTTEKDEVEFEIGGKGTAVIDWGDGTAPQTVTLSHRDYCKHVYTKKAAHHISIDSDGITLLRCPGNELTSLAVGNNPVIELNCVDNRLTSLDVSKATALSWMTCSRNRLTTLDVSNNTALTNLSCHNNRLTSLDVSNNTALTELYCDNNQLTAEGVNALFGTLHSNPFRKKIDIVGNPGAADCNRSIATAKKWEVDPK